MRARTVTLTKRHTATRECIAKPAEDRSPYKQWKTTEGV